jgi:hypothetical protein
MTQSFNVPDSFSMKELENMMSTAIPEEIAQECEDQVDIHDNSEERLTELACRLVNQANDLTDGPLLNKVMALDILSRLIDWHTKIGTEMMEKGEDRSGVSWLRDAGKLQAAAVLLADVCLGPEDFTSTDV